MPGKTLFRAGSMRVLCMLLMAMAACSSELAQRPGEIELGAPTPEALARRLDAAAAREDLLEIVASLDPAQARELIEGMLTGTTMMLAFSAMGGDAALSERLGGELGTILGRHGLAVASDEEGGDPEALRQALAGLSHAGLARLAKDLAGLLQSLSARRPGVGAELVSVPHGALTDLVIDGDQGTGTLGGDPLEFVRIDGRWFARLPGPL